MPQSQCASARNRPDSGGNMLFRDVRGCIIVDCHKFSIRVLYCTCIPQISIPTVVAQVNCITPIFPVILAQTWRGSRKAMLGSRISNCVGCVTQPFLLIENHASYQYNAFHEITQKSICYLYRQVNRNSVAELLVISYKR